jgi:5'-3' exoribonuclease 1
VAHPSLPPYPQEHPQRRGLSTHWYHLISFSLPVYIDNLYLDLNGIVHNCIHGNDSKLHERVSRLGEDFDEVWANIMKAIDEIVHTVKPKKLLFLAVDGVAPRAKMNQQRARRFRSAKDSMMLREQLLSQGKEAPDLFDSNAISPGTKFMFELNR